MHFVVFHIKLNSWLQQGHDKEQTYFSSRACSWTSTPAGGSVTVTYRSKGRSTPSPPRGSAYGSCATSLTWRKPADHDRVGLSWHLSQRKRGLWQGRSPDGPPCPPQWSPAKQRSVAQMFMWTDKQVAAQPTFTVYICDFTINHFQASWGLFPTQVFDFCAFL